LLGLTSFGVARAITVAAAAIVATRLLGPHQRGLMVLGVTMGSVATVLVGMGTGSALRARIPGATEAGRRLLVAAFAWWSVLSAAVSGVVAVVFSALSARVIDPGLGDPRFLAAVFINTAGQVVLIQLPDAWYAGARFRVGSAWAGVVAAAGTFGVLGGAAIDRSAWSLLAAQGAGMAAAGIFQAAHLGSAGLFSLSSLPWRRVLELPAAGARALGMTLGLMIALRMDRYALGVVTGPAEVAVYSLAMTLCALPGLVPIAVGQLALRDVSTGAGLAYVRRACQKALGWAAVSSLPILAGSWLLVVPVFGPDFAGARPLLAWLLLAGVIFAPFEVASRSLLGGGWMGTAGLLGGAGCLAAVLLHTTLTPRFGTPGAALSCGILYAGLSAAAWFAVRHRVPNRDLTPPRSAISF
jgi:O-antigen/teichoic acid export membrane protein